jgi:hypothetical protein
VDFFFVVGSSLTSEDLLLEDLRRRRPMRLDVWRERLLRLRRRFPRERDLESEDEERLRFRPLRPSPEDRLDDTLSAFLTPVASALSVSCVLELSFLP